MAAGHDKIEKNIGLMIVLVIITISIGGLVQIVPLFFQHSTTEAVDGLEPYSPLRLAGRYVFVREVCYLCHSQMIRPFRAETARSGHYSGAGEYVYDGPFLWGSKRTGPDLARVGNRYSDEWHRVHLINPRDVVPESIMPGYPWLEENAADASSIKRKLEVLRMLGAPNSDEDIANAPQALEGKTEMDAVIAYLQGMGTAIKTRR